MPQIVCRHILLDPPCEASVSRGQEGVSRFYLGQTKPGLSQEEIRSERNMIVRKKIPQGLGTEGRPHPPDDPLRTPARQRALARGAGEERASPSQAWGPGLVPSPIALDLEVAAAIPAAASEGARQGVRHKLRAFRSQAELQ